MYTTDAVLSVILSIFFHFRFVSSFRAVVAAYIFFKIKNWKFSIFYSKIWVPLIEIVGGWWNRRRCPLSCISLVDLLCLTLGFGRSIFPLCVGRCPWIPASISREKMMLQLQSSTPWTSPRFSRILLYTRLVRLSYFLFFYFLSFFLWIQNIWICV